MNTGEMNTGKREPIYLPIAPKDVFRILALRSIVATDGLFKTLNDKFVSILQGIPRSPRLIRNDPFKYPHTGLSGKAKNRADDKNENFNMFTERELCASRKAFFAQSFEESIGTVIDYEIPLDDERSSAFGKIDLVSLTAKGELFLLEVKKFESNEHPLRAMFEILTFWKMLKDEDGGFDGFIEGYKECPQFNPAVSSGTIKSVVPGLLLHESSKIMEPLIGPGKPKPIEIELYRKFLSDEIGLHIFSYSHSVDEGWTVTDVTKEVKGNCGIS